MKYKEFKSELRKFGCFEVRHGGSHDVWQAPNGKRFTVPRHDGEVPPSTERKIRKEVGML